MGGYPVGKWVGSGSGGGETPRCGHLFVLETAVGQLARCVGQRTCCAELLPFSPAAPAAYEPHSALPLWRLQRSMPFCPTTVPPLPPSLPLVAAYEPHSVLPFGGCVFTEHAEGMPRCLTNTYVASTSTVGLLWRMIVGGCAPWDAAADIWCRRRCRCCRHPVLPPPPLLPLLLLGELVD